MENNLLAFNTKICFNLEYKEIELNNKWNKISINIQPLIKELKDYLILCDESDFNFGNHKLKFKEDHYIKISSIFDMHKELLVIDENKFLFILYGYWFSELVTTYYEKYFNIKKLQTYMKDTLICKFKCKECNEYFDIEISSRGYFDEIKNCRYDDFICCNCENKIK